MSFVQPGSGPPSAALGTPASGLPQGTAATWLSQEPKSSLKSTSHSLSLARSFEATVSGEPKVFNPGPTAAWKPVVYYCDNGWRKWTNTAAAVGVLHPGAMLRSVATERTVTSGRLPIQDDRGEAGSASGDADSGRGDPDTGRGKPGSAGGEAGSGDFFAKLSDEVINKMSPEGATVRYFRLKGGQATQYLFIKTESKWENAAVSMGLCSGRYAVAVTMEPEPDLHSLEWTSGVLKWLDTLHVGAKMTGVTGNDSDRYFIDYKRKACSSYHPKCSTSRSCSSGYAGGHILQNPFEVCIYTGTEYDSSVESQLNPVASIELDEQGYVVACNSKTLHMFKRLRREVIGSAVETFIPFEHARAHKRYLANLLPDEKEKRALARKKSTLVNVPLMCPAGTVAIRKDGTVFKVSLKFHVVSKKGKSKHYAGRVRVYMQEQQDTDQSEAAQMTDEVVACHGLVAVGLVAHGLTNTFTDISSHTTTTSPKTGVRGLMSRYHKNFEELKDLGKGNFGAVMQCRNKLDNELYAVKQVRLGMADQLAEAEAASQLKEIGTMARLGAHPNIVRYYTSWIEMIPIAMLADTAAEGTDAAGSLGWGSFMNEPSSASDDEREPDSELVNTLFIQMELVKGNTLEDFLQDTARKVHRVLALHIFFQVLRGLHFVSLSGVIHRDLKPANILLATVSEKSHDRKRRSRTSSAVLDDDPFEAAAMDQRYHVKITDFGLSCISESDWDDDEGALLTQDPLNSVAMAITVDKETETRPEDRSISKGSGSSLLVVPGMMTVKRRSKLGPAADDQLRRLHSMRKTTGIGTKLYAAPEQLQQSNGQGRTASTFNQGVYDDKVDIFALGMVLAELFSDPPKNNMEHFMTLSKIREGKLPPEFPKNYPQEAALAMKMLDKEATHRPSTAEVMVDLKELLSGFELGPKLGSRTASTSISHLERENESLRHRLQQLTSGRSSERLSSLAELGTEESD